MCVNNSVFCYKSLFRQQIWSCRIEFKLQFFKLHAFYILFLYVIFNIKTVWGQSWISPFRGLTICKWYNSKMTKNSRISPTTLLQECILIGLRWQTEYKTCKNFRQMNAKADIAINFNCSWYPLQEDLALFGWLQPKHSRIS